MLASAFVVLMLGAVTSAPAAAIPYAKTAVDDLSTRSLAHHEVLRIRRDFGKPSFEIVVDSWTRAIGPDELSDVRLWWVQPDRGDVRSPFSERVHKYVELDYEPRDPDHWTVVLRADRKEFAFDVSLEGEQARAYADIETSGGETIEHCRATSGRLVARRLVGIPIGIKRLEIECEGPDGRTHTGSLPYKKLKRGPVYKG